MAHINSAEKYLSELDYEQAIAEYMTALEIEPNEKAVYDALEQIYLEYAQSYLDCNNYAEAEIVLRRGIELLNNAHLQKNLEEVEVIQKKEKLLNEGQKELEKRQFKIFLVSLC